LIIHGKNDESKYQVYQKFRHKNSVKLAHTRSVFTDVICDAINTATCCQHSVSAEMHTMKLSNAMQKRTLSKCISWVPKH